MLAQWLRCTPRTGVQEMKLLVTNGVWQLQELNLHLLSPYKWQNLKAITSLAKAFFSLSCSSDCPGQSLLPPSASRSTSLCHSYTCPAKSPSIPMYVSQPCWHSKKDSLNGGWSQTTTAQTPPNRTVLSGLAQGGRKHSLSHLPPPKMQPWLLSQTCERLQPRVADLKSTVQDCGHYFVSEGNTGDSNENKLFQESLKPLTCSNVAETLMSCMLCLVETL